MNHHVSLPVCPRGMNESPCQFACLAVCLSFQLSCNRMQLFLSELTNSDETLHSCSIRNEDVDEGGYFQVGNS